jgi:excisionase family DNA binding protein
MDRLLTAQEAAEFLNIPLNTLRAWSSERKITRISVNKNFVRYRKEDLEKFINDNLVEAHPIHSRKSGSKN